MLNHFEKKVKQKASLDAFDKQKRMLAGKKIDPRAKMPQGTARDFAAEDFHVAARYISGAKLIKKEAKERQGTRTDISALMHESGRSDEFAAKERMLGGTPSPKMDKGRATEQAGKAFGLILLQ